MKSELRSGLSNSLMKAGCCCLFGFISRFGAEMKLQQIKQLNQAFIQTYHSIPMPVFQLNQFAVC